MTRIGLILIFTLIYINVSYGFTSYTHSEIYHLFRTNQEFLDNETLKLPGDDNVDIYFYTDANSMVSVYVKMTNNTYNLKTSAFKIYYFSEEYLISQYGANWRNTMHTNVKYYDQDGNLIKDFNTAKFGELIDLYNQYVVVPGSNNIPINNGLAILLVAGLVLGGYLLRNTRKLTMT